MQRMDNLLSVFYDFYLKKCNSIQQRSAKRPLGASCWWQRRETWWRLDDDDEESSDVFCVLCLKKEFQEPMSGFEFDGNGRRECEGICRTGKSLGNLVSWDPPYATIKILSCYIIILSINIMVYSFSLIRKVGVIIYSDSEIWHNACGSRNSCK